MEYVPKTIPEGINTSKEHPIKEFAILTGGISLILVIAIYLVAISTDYLVQYIPIEKENEWFSYERLTDDSDEENILELDSKTIKINTYLSSLVESLKDEKHKQFNFTINLIEDKAPNAFITPGSHIFVTTGLLESVNSENGLAMVIGHEMGHQYHRHPIKSMGRGIVIAMTLMIVSGTDSDDLIQGFVGNTAGLASLTFSRKQEREADKTGVELLIQEYHHTSGANEFFKKILSDSEDDSYTPVFLSTHPGTEERIKFLEEFGRNYTGKPTPLPQYVIDYVKQMKKDGDSNKT